MVLSRLLSRAQQISSSHYERQVERRAAEVLFFISPPDPYGSVAALLDRVVQLRDRQMGRMTSSYGGDGSSRSRGGDPRTHAIAEILDIEDRVKRALRHHSLRWLLIDAGFGEWSVEPRQCSVCTSPLAVDVDARLAAGDSVREISAWTASAGELPLSRSAIGRHRIACWIARRSSDPDSMRRQIDALREAAERSLREADRITRLMADIQNPPPSQEGGTSDFPTVATVRETGD